MRKLYKHIYIFVAVPFIMASCAEKFGHEPATSKGISEITAHFAEDDTKTMLAEDEKNILWSPKDSIGIFYEGYGMKFTSENIEPEQSAIFRSHPTVFINTTETGAGIDGPYLYGVYPYNSENSSDGESVVVSVPDYQIASQSSFGKDSFVAVGRSKDENIAFYNVCGGIRFYITRKGVHRITITGNNGEILAGKVKVVFDGKLPKVSEIIEGKQSISLTAEGGAFKVGEWYYMSILPTEIKQGLKFEFDCVDALGSYTIPSSIVIKRSTFGSLPGLDKNVEYIDVGKDLSKSGTANCYVVPKEGRYKFKAMTKGGSSEPIGKPVSAEVLWESFGTGVAPSIGDIVSNISFSDGYVRFTTADELNDGNALVAVKDSTGTILWSWHIWVCKDFDPAKMAQVYNNNAGTVMDRNLGATSATPGDIRAFGLLYQWGRKDPFLGAIDEDHRVQASPSLPTPQSVSDVIVGDNTLAYSISHPSTFIKPFQDWYCLTASSQNNELWSSQKTIFDPCPNGWRVPDGGDDGLWSMAFGDFGGFVDGPWDAQNKGFDFGSGNGQSLNHQLGPDMVIWYPTVGYLTGDGSIQSFRFDTVLWSCTPHKKTYYPWYDSYTMRTYYFLDVFDVLTREVYPTDYSSRCYGYSVRCVAE